MCVCVCVCVCAWVRMGSMWVGARILPAMDVVRVRVRVRAATSVKGWRGEMDRTANVT